MYKEFKKINDPSIKLLVEIQGMSDSIINGKMQQYYYEDHIDYSKPLKQKFKQFEYSIPGEVVAPYRLKNKNFEVVGRA